MAKKPTKLGSQTVLDFLGGEGDTVDYAHKLEANPADRRRLHLRRIRLPRAMWEDLGKPDQINVTIEPGDNS